MATASRSLATARQMLRTDLGTFYRNEGTAMLALLDGADRYYVLTKGETVATGLQGVSSANGCIRDEIPAEAPIRAQGFTHYIYSW